MNKEQQSLAIAIEALEKIEEECDTCNSDYNLVYVTALRESKEALQEINQLTPNEL